MNSKDGECSCDYTKLQVQLASAVISNVELMDMLATSGKDLDKAVAETSAKFLEAIIND